MNHGAISGVALSVTHKIPMLKQLILILSFILIAIGCQAQPPSTPTTEPPPAHHSGRLAYVGGDGNIYLTTADRSEVIAVTDDATAPPENTGFSYHRVAWSPDGQLAYAGVERTGNRANSTLYVAESPGASPRVIAQDDEHFFIYIHWSPVPCPDRPQCRQLAYLIEKEAGQIGLHLVEIEAERVDNRLLGQGRPFYFGWMPDGQQMLWHTGGSSRFNPEARLASYDIEHDVIEALPHSPASFLSPAGSPQGDQWLAAITEEDDDTLQSFGVEPLLSVARTNAGHQTAFVWSPDGRQVAYAAVSNLTDPFYGPIHIFDVETGEARQLTGNTFRVNGFFWSPDGQKLAYLHQVATEESWLQWRVVDLTTGVERGYNVFTPSYQMRYVIASFDQYAQSHRFWSPDSRFLVYGDQDKDRVERVYLVDTLAERGTPPIFIDEGTIGFWSWN